MTWNRLRGGPVLVGLLLLLAGRFAAVSVPIHLKTQDVNHDRQADVWEYATPDGALVHKSVDTNFDGRSDVQESYQGRQIIRRESDRNFDDQIDLTEEFDPATGEHTRSVIDIDFDGRADLLVLFAHGKPASSQWAPRRDRPRPILSPGGQRSV